MNKSKVGRVLELFISEKGNKNRVNQEQLSLDSNGVLKDKFYAKNIQRSVLLASKESYNLTKEHNININYGQLGENILIDYNPYHLSIGTQIQIGDVVLEISQACTLCNSLAKVGKELPQLLKDDRGIFAKVITNGNICKEDSIYIL